MRDHNDKKFDDNYSNMTSLTKTFKNLNWKLVKKYRTSLKYTLALGSLAFVLYIFFIIKMLNSTEKIVFYPNMCHIYPNELSMYFLYYRPILEMTMDV